MNSTMRISELARQLQVDQSLITLWEKEFGLSIQRSAQGHRVYTAEDRYIFEKIKSLMLEKGVTIAEAKKQLKKIVKAKPEQVMIAASKPNALVSSRVIDKQLKEKMFALQQKLLKLRELL